MRLSVDKLEKLGNCGHCKAEFRAPAAREFLAAPTLKEFGLSSSELDLLKKPQSEDGLLGWATVGSLLLCAYLYKSSIPGASLAGALFFSFVLTVTVVGIWSKLRDFIRASSPENKKRHKYSQYTAAVSEYERRIAEIENTQRRMEHERQELEKRAKVAFWETLTGYEFEIELAKLYGAIGYSARRTQGSGDEGVDIYLEKDSRTIVVQCKNQRKPVGPAAVRDLYGTMVHQKADEAVLASTAGFTDGAREFARGKSIQLVSMTNILSMQEQISSRST